MNLVCILLLSLAGFSAGFCPARQVSRNVVTMPTQTRAIVVKPLGGFLRMAEGEDDETSAEAASSEASSVCIGDIAKYSVATGLQFSIIMGFLKAIDVAVKKPIPTPLVGLLFCFLSLRSRVASLLDNSRPNREAQDGKATPSDVKRPSWTPPGIAFPFIWLTITGLRGVSSALVYRQTGTLVCSALQAMVLHLCVGDTWNCITNVEKRLGVSASGVLLVWATVWSAVIEYYKVLPLAGKVLLPSGIWITIATVLTFSIWRLNKPIEPLWPVKGDGKSASWKFQNLGQLEATNIRGGK